MNPKEIKHMEKLAKKVKKGKIRFTDLSETEQANLKNYCVAKSTQGRDFTSSDIKRAVKTNSICLGADFVQHVNAARKADDFMKHNAEPYLMEYLREGFVGKEIVINNVRYMQLDRGKPYGVLIAVKNGDSISIGYSLLNKKDEKVAVQAVGMKIAYDRAIAARANNAPATLGPDSLDENTRAQLTHFKDRALAYFQPEKYSYKKGTEPIKNANYDVIRGIQAVIKKTKVLKAKASKKK